MIANRSDRGLGRSPIVLGSQQCGLPIRRNQKGYVLLGLAQLAALDMRFIAPMEWVTCNSVNGELNVFPPP